MLYVLIRIVSSNEYTEHAIIFIEDWKHPNSILICLQTWHYD